MQKERNDQGLCTRCGRRDHKWYHDTGKIVVAAAASAVAAGEAGKKKRKRKQKQDSSRDDGETEKKPKVSAICYTPDRRNTFHGITGTATDGILTPRLDLLPYPRLDQLGWPQKKSIVNSHTLEMSFRSAGIDGIDSENELRSFYLK